MCGIIGVTGGSGVTELLLDGLARLEYRGYDSAGLVLQAEGTLWRARDATKPSPLEGLRKVAEDAPVATAGIGHTRWATHGHPNEGNAHPHLDCTGRVAIIHNGIIENWRELRARLLESGHVLASDTDSEAIAHLVEEELATGVDLTAAVRAVVGELRGAFALGVVSADEPETIVAARRVSPLLVGLGDSEAREGLLASDIPAILGRTRTVWALEDDEIAVLRPGSVEITSLAGDPVEHPAIEVGWDLEAAERGDYDDFMSKEMAEQPQAVTATLVGRLLPEGILALDEMHRLTDGDLQAVDKVFIVACGSSYHAGLVAKYAIERWLHLPAEIDIASEFRYRDPVLDGRTLVVGVSQSGETVDTTEAMRHARSEGAKVLVISNVVDSSMAREADGVLYTRAGPEIGVAATKTHLAQIAALEVLALYLAQLRGALPGPAIAGLLDHLRGVPDLIGEALARDEAVAGVAARFVDTRDFFYLGRHVGFPVALEGALKLKEIAYVRAEAYPAGELKHGPIALIEPGTVVLAVATRNRLWDKLKSNIQEVRSRGATVVVVAQDGDGDSAAEASSPEHVLWVPPTEELFSPLVDVVPLQQFAYHLARAHGYDVDRPRNLAKTVTVE